MKGDTPAGGGEMPAQLLDIHIQQVCRLLVIEILDDHQQKRVAFLPS